MRGSESSGAVLQGLGGKVRQVKDVSKEAVDATRKTLGRRKHDKTCRVHLKVGSSTQMHWVFTAEIWEMSRQNKTLFWTVGNKVCGRGVLQQLDLRLSNYVMQSIDIGPFLG